MQLKCSCECHVYQYDVIVVFMITELFVNIVCNVVAKDSGVVTITRASSVFVNKGQGAPDILLIHGGGHSCV